MDVITTDNLTRRFGPVTAVDGISFSVAEGELFGLVGSDGAGKTTILRMLAGILDPTAGDAWVAGRHTVREASSLRGAIGYMSQRFGLYPDLSVQENIDFYADLFGIPARGRAETIDRLLAFSNLTPFRRRLAGNLSGGMKQKLGLACALVHTPTVLLLDEPTNGVDPLSRRDFWRILHGLLRQGVTIVVATAYLDEAERCHRVALVHDGRLLACAPPADLQGLMRGSILEVRTPAVRQAIRLLREGTAALSVGRYGERLHVVTDNPAQLTGDVLRVMAQAGLAVDDIRPIEPSLEDVLVSVLANREPPP